MNYEFLLEYIRQHFPDADTTVTVLNSGAVDIAIRQAGRLVVVQCVGTGGYGVSLVAPGDAALVGHDEVLFDPHDVAREVEALLR